MAVGSGRGTETTDPPWSYDELVTTALASVGSAVDLGTGGGEWLLARSELPPDTHATEGWAPNLPLALRALAPRGVELATYDADAGDRLPYPQPTLRPRARPARGLLGIGGVPGAAPGRDVPDPAGRRTQHDLVTSFGGSAPYPAITLAPLRAGLETAGLGVDLAEQWSGPITFADVATMVAFLRLMPWQLPAGWSVAGYAETLLALHQRCHQGEPLRFTEPRLVLRATRPPG